MAALHSGRSSRHQHVVDRCHARMIRRMGVGRKSKKRLMARKAERLKFTLTRESYG